MQDLLNQYYDWLRAIHIIAVISWMAGMLYLPRLFVYHTKTTIGSEMSQTFKTMERRLLKIIINPAMIIAWIFGMLMLYSRWDLFVLLPWMHAKLLFVILMTILHHIYVKHVKLFAIDQNKKSTKYFKILNEIPALFTIIIVIMAVAEPFN